MVAPQEHPDQTRTPGRVVPAKLQRFAQELANGKRLGIVTAQVSGSNALLAVVAQASDQVTDGAGDEAERLGDGGAALPLLDTLLDDETEGYRDGMWHEQASLSRKGPSGRP
jgi:hypothetical protein